MEVESPAIGPELQAILQSGVQFDYAVLKEIVIQCYTDALRRDTAARWNDAMRELIRQREIGIKPRELFRLFLQGLTGLEELQNAYLDALNCAKRSIGTETRLMEDFQLVLRANMFYESCYDTRRAVETIVQIAFDAFLISRDSVKLSDVCSVCHCDMCECANIVDEHFLAIKQALTRLSLYDRLLDDTPVTVATSAMQLRIGEKLGKPDGTLHALTQWVGQLADGWLDGVCANEPTPTDAASRRRLQLLHHFHSAYAHHALCALYDTLESYPGSEPALADLKVCMGKVHVRQELVTRLGEQVKARLLHSGVNTYDILTMYTRIVSGLRSVDPSGVLMEAVCKPIRCYIRQRADSVRCIASFLTHKHQLDLWRTAPAGGKTGSEQSTSGGGQQTAGPFESPVDAAGSSTSAGGGATDCDIDLNSTALHVHGRPGDHKHAAHVLTQWRQWQPDPVDAPPGSSSGSRRHADMVSMLVGIYGTKELFVTEYRELLAERMLRCKADATRQLLDDETMYLEMLKGRFGAPDMHQCEVMLKDVSDSERLRNDWLAANKNRLPRGHAAKALDSLQIMQLAHCAVRVLSAHFWPRLCDAALPLPAVVQRVLDDFRSHFEKAKSNRTLEWLPQTGTMRLAMHDQSVLLSVTPLQAVVLSKFLEKDTWPPDAIACTLSLGASAVRRRCQSLFALGILVERQGNWALCQRLPSQRVVNGIEADGGATQHANDDDAQEESESDALAGLEQYWGYISGLLHNMASLKAERLHSLLRMFTSPGKDVPSLRLVQTFLNRKVKADLLVFNAGAYSLPKK